MKIFKRVFDNEIETLSKSIQEISSDCENWANEISKTFAPDLIVFIAKSGFLFARPLAEVMKCPMVDITATRPSNKGKDKAKRIIEHIPEKIIMLMLKSPFMYLFHEMKKEREICITPRYKGEVAKEHKRILIVDDSVDTGHTLCGVVERVKTDFPKAEIKTAGYSVIAYSRRRIKVDYCRYENVIVLTATSRRSNEYGKFLNLYQEWLYETESEGNT